MLLFPAFRKGSCPVGLSGRHYLTWGLFFALSVIPVAALADPLPTCSTTMYWSAASYNVYMSTSPTEIGTKVATVPVTPPLVLSYPCPTTPGVYYFRDSVNSVEGQEGVLSLPMGMSVGGVQPPPPPPTTFMIGAPVRVNTAAWQALNVRPAPSLSSCKICPTVPSATLGVILDGPVSADGATWWKVQYAAMTGWSSQAFLVVVVP